MHLEGFPETLTLRDGSRVLVRPMQPDDGPALLDFFRSLPVQDRLFLREDVTREEVIDRFVQHLDYDRVLPLLAEFEGRIVGDGTLHRSQRGWASHVGEIRLVVDPVFQRRGLGTALARLLVKVATGVGLDKLVAQVVDNQVGAKRAFGKLGFYPEAILKGHVKDIHGAKRDLVILANDVSHIWETMESLVSDYSPSTGD
jgi:RimJ/RimL family protein N-acetyltransferase